MFDIDIKNFFSDEITEIDCVDHSKLDSSRLSHRKKFVEKVEEIIMIIELDITMLELNVRNAISKILEQIYNDITYTVNVARKFVEGPKRKVLYSHTKLVKYTAILYWKMRIKKKLSHIVNKNKLEECRVLIDIDNN